MSDAEFWDFVDKLAKTESDRRERFILKALKKLSDDEFLVFVIRFYEAWIKIGGILLIEAVELAYGGPELGDDGYMDHRFWIFTLGRKAWLSAILNPDFFYVAYRELMPDFPMTELDYVSKVIDDESMRRFGEPLPRSNTLLDGPRDVFSDHYPKSQIPFLFPDLYSQKNDSQKSGVLVDEKPRVDLSKGVSDNLFWNTISPTIEQNQEAQSAKLRLALNKMTPRQFIVFKAYLHFYLRKLGSGLHLETLDFFRGSHDSQLVNIEDHNAWIVSQGFQRYVDAIVSPDYFYSNLNRSRIDSTPIYPDFLKLVRTCELEKFGEELKEEVCPVDRHRCFEDAEEAGELETYRDFYPLLFKTLNG